MSILKSFNEKFGLEDGVEKEKRRFVQRVNQSIFYIIDTEQSDDFNYHGLFEDLCFELGVNAQNFEMRRSPSFIHVNAYRPASIRTLTKDDFMQTLLVLNILFRVGGTYTKNLLSKGIEASLTLCTCDIGIRWKDGTFYPAGAEELDKPLAEETLTWLNDYPEERKDYQNALKYYLGKQSLPDVIKNCYSAVEGIARKVLGNEKTLDNNKDELLAKMNLSDGWKSMLASYIKYAHEYRHASPERHEITTQEAEAYLYMTGLIIRLIIESK